jgi:hypothetical protein
VKLLDFSRQDGRPRSPPTQAPWRARCARPHHMSPEQLEGRTPTAGTSRSVLSSTRCSPGRGAREARRLHLGDLDPPSRPSLDPGSHGPARSRPPGQTCIAGTRGPLAVGGDVARGCADLEARPRRSARSLRR